LFDRVIYAYNDIYNITQRNIRACVYSLADYDFGVRGGGCRRRIFLARKRTTLYIYIYIAIIIFVSRTNGGWHDEGHPSSGNNSQHLLYWFRSLATVPRWQFKLNATMIMICAHTRTTFTHILRPNTVFADSRRSFRKDLLDDASSTTPSPPNPFTLDPNGVGLIIRFVPNR